MVRIVVNHDRIRIPEPVCDVRIVKRGDIEIKPAEPEPLAVAALQMENMTRSNSAAKPAVLEGMLEMEVRIVPPGIVPDPTSIVVDMRGVWMAFHVAMIMFWNGSRSRRVNWRGTVRRDVAAAWAAAMLFMPLLMTLLRKAGCEKNHQERRGKAN